MIYGLGSNTTAAKVVTSVIPVATENSPDANGKFGLFTWRQINHHDYDNKHEAVKLVSFDFSGLQELRVKNSNPFCQDRECVDINSYL